MTVRTIEHLKGNIMSEDPENQDVQVNLIIQKQTNAKGETIGYIGRPVPFDGKNPKHVGSFNSLSETRDFLTKVFGVNFKVGTNKKPLSTKMRSRPESTAGFDPHKRR